MKKTSSVAALLMALITGIVIGATATPFTTTVDEGLVTALNSVGKNLFGSKMFGAQVNASDETDEVQIDFVLYPPDPIFPELFPKRINFAFFPAVGQDCEIGLQVNIAADGSMSGIIDPAILPMFDIEYSELPIPGAFCGNPAVIIDPQ